MTRKGKLSKKQRQRQQKEQRRAAMARVRQRRGWKTPPPPTKGNEILDDMLPLFPEIANPSAPLPSMDTVLTVLLDSKDLIDEPEFEDIIVDPLLCVSTFIEVGEEIGLDPDSLQESSEKESADTYGEILLETCQLLLTDELRQEILEGLDSFRLRMKQAGDLMGAARAAAMQSFLGDKASGEIWSMIGLVQAIFHRSIFIGFELAESSRVAMEAKEAGENPAALVERLAQSEMGRRTEALLKRVPGLNKYLTRQADATWEEGQDAVYMGDLYLQLYSEDELATGVEMFEETFGEGVADEEELFTDQAREFVLRVDAHVAELFTAERLDQLRARLDQLLKERGVEEKWLAFLLMLKQYMARPDAAENERPFLVHAFLGELYRSSGEVEEELKTIRFNQDSRDGPTTLRSGVLRLSHAAGRGSPAR